ncbi:MAG: aspartate carbamoyltransferase catalytic subunit, partial [Chloroflexota bacterium]
MKLKTEARETLSTPWPHRHRHILDLDDFSPGDVELVFNTAEAMKEILSREIKRVPTLRGKTVVTLFYEPSTRTRASFELAAKNLSADVVSVTSTTSSVVKGESLVDTIRTLESLGADVIVLRHPCSGAPNLAAQSTSVSIINAGDGWHAHPTQALLDLYTVREVKKKLDGLKVVIVGDVLHSRVARSNIWGFSLMGADVVLCGPPPLLPSWWGKAYPWVRLEWDVERALDGADVVMALRLQ